MLGLIYFFYGGVWFNFLLGGGAIIYFICVILDFLLGGGAIIYFICVILV